VSCTTTFAQRAAVAALDGPQDCVDGMLAAFRRRREVVVAGLNELPGVRCLAPAGAFYAFPNITRTGLKSQQIADYLLNEAGVACLSGASFGQYGEGYLRLSYANSLPNIQVALDRMAEALRRLPVG
jgi:aspartate/methionine/tyrosine aminotransferase